MRHRLMPRVTPLAISILVVLTLLVPAAYFTFPHIYRWRMLEGIHSDDADRRARSFGYIAGLADKDDAVLAGALDRMDALRDDRRFIDMVTALQAAEQWDRSIVGDEHWLRWIALVADNPEPDGRIAAAHLLGDLPPLAEDPRVLRVLESLLADDAADVRFNAMFVAAELWAAGAPTVEFERLVAGRTGDDQPAIVRQAWLLLGLMDPLEGFVADWQDAPPRVAEAIVWAAVRTNPRAVAPAIAALRDEGADPRVRAAGAYALNHRLTDHPAAVEACLNGLKRFDPAAVTDDDADLSLIPWRLILGLAPGAGADPGTGQPPWVEAIAGSDQPVLEPLRLALVHRLGITPDAWPGEDDVRGWLTMLAALEASPDLSQLELPGLPGVTPPLHRIAAVAAGVSQDPDDLGPVFRSEVSTLRDLACLTAYQRFEGGRLDPLIVKLLTDLNDTDKMSGAILAGMTGLQPELLRKRYASEDQPEVRVVMRLGLWMQGDRDILDPPEALMLVERESLNIGSTVLLAMLHVGEQWPQTGAARAALDYLLNPRGEPDVALRTFFDQLRWWRVLGHYLPALLGEAGGEADTPPFWVWGDPQLQSFQIDVLRNWYLLHRHELPRP